jgi:hypothetical protein
MDANRFAVITRFQTERPSRRGLMHALTSGGLAAIVNRSLGGSDIAAKRNHHKKRKKKKTKGRCSPNCPGKTSCLPQARAATCVGRCGSWPNNCDQSVACETCPPGKQCLTNGSCADVCATYQECPLFNCDCRVTVEGPQVCVLAGPPCASIPQQCTSTAECLLGELCVEKACGPGGSAQYRCVPLCAG